ncbi:hypothetical protein [Hymenobacter sp. CRA2]|uniref:hypothetical protein n=1 Tax=Hymenobacter sp. CRA2 TaxID=1955620 RepID=UPI00098F36E8|nr:hypothetical protein [Hymenobacter sp. CRA2]OON69314.1 hypothetical protein B0919_08470 [Hymenobacter sp. CRA2]
MLLTACGSPAGEDAARSTAAPAVVPVAAASETDAADLAAADTADQYATMYVVVADTNLHYRPLHRQMLRLHAATGQRHTGPLL